MLLLLFCWGKVFFSFRQKTSNFKSNLCLLEDASSARVSMSTVDKTTWWHPLIDFPPLLTHTHEHDFGRLVSRTLHNVQFQGSSRAANIAPFILVET